MTSHELILVAGLAALGSGIPALLLSKKSNAGQVLSTMILIAANGVGLYAVCRWWNAGPIAPIVFPSPIQNVSVTIAIDGISAFFLIPILLVTALSSIYGLQYWKQTEQQDNGRRVSLFLGTITGAMTLLVVAQDGLMFLAAWETMAVSALFLVAAEDRLAETRKAAWLYIAASHFATLCAFGVFAPLYAINGSFDFATLKDAGTPLAITLAVLAFVGFGTKAGIMPMHVWLPSAHAASSEPRVGGDVRSDDQDGHLRHRPGVHVLPGGAIVMGVVRTCDGDRLGDPRRGIRGRTARHQAIAGVSQHREYRDHRHGAGPGPHRTGREPTTVGLARHLWRNAARVESCPV